MQAERFTTKAQAALQSAQRIAQEHSNQEVDGEHLLSALPLFKASKFFLNAEMSLVDCLVAPVIWRLPWLQVDLGREGKPIIDYGERLFHSQGFARSMTDQERAMRQLHEQE